MKSKRRKPVEGRTFKIFRVEKEYVKPGLFKKPYVKTNKITMKKFSAKDFDEARSELQEYKRLANKEYTYYVEETHQHVVIDKNGKKKVYDSCIDEWEEEAKSRPIIVRAWSWLTLELWYWFVDRPNTFRYWVRDLIYFLKNKHDYKESWNLDCHILQDMLWNIPILIENKHGIAYPFLDKAVKETHAKEKGFDIKEWNKTHYTYTDEEEKKAIEYQNEEYERVLEYIKLYEYYRDGGSIDETDPKQVEFDKKLHYTLPIIPGTYDSLDYDKLNVLTERNWNKIWEWMRKFGQTLWD